MLDEFPFEIPFGAGAILLALAGLLLLGLAIESTRALAAVAATAVHALTRAVGMLILVVAISALVVVLLVR